MNNIKRIITSRSEYEDLLECDEYDLLEHMSDIRERLRQGSSPEAREQRLKLERERYRERRRKFWRRYFKIMTPLWILLAGLWFAVLYFKIH